MWWYYLIIQWYFVLQRAASLLTLFSGSSAQNMNVEWFPHLTWSVLRSRLYPCHWVCVTCESVHSLVMSTTTYFIQYQSTQNKSQDIKESWHELSFFHITFPCNCKILIFSTETRLSWTSKTLASLGSWQLSLFVADLFYYFNDGTQPRE